MAALSGTQAELEQLFTSIFAAGSPMARVRDSEPGGFDRGLWDSCLAAGLIDAAAASVNDPDGIGITALARVAEAAGKYLVPAPVVAAMAAGRLFTALEPLAAAQQALESLSQGEAISFYPRRAEGAHLALVPHGSSSSSAVAFRGDEVVLVRAASPRSAGWRSLGDDGSLDWEVGDLTVLARGADARRLWDACLRDWTVLTASQLNGMGAGALALATSYAKTRSAFGTPIGAFQAVSHRLVDCFVGLDGSRLLTMEVAAAIDADQHCRPDDAFVAFHAASRAATETSLASLHTHGGFGFALEYDIQLYLRRAMALSLVLGDPDGILRRIGADFLACGQTAP